MGILATKSLVYIVFFFPAPIVSAPLVYNIALLDKYW